jgi:hypothetical protein
VQLAAHAKANAHMANPWWFDLLICALLVSSVVVLMQLQAMQAGSSSSMRLAGWISTVSRKLTDFRLGFRRYVY